MKILRATRHLSAAFVLTLFVIPVQAAQAEDLIIRNVHIANAGSSAPATLVSLRIQKGILDVVSEGPIDTEGNTKVLDARNGFLLGTLTPDSAPKFMILDEDPVADLSVLLDTEPHVVFAIDNGQIVVNKLPTEISAAPDPDAKEKKWIAYDPPPFALPGSIDADHWNSWKSRWVNGVFISALAIDRQFISQDEASIAQFGDLAAERERGTIRGWRFGVAGTINFDRPWVYSIAGAWNAFDRGFETSESDKESFSIIEYFIDIPVGVRTTLRVGNQKEPINMDRSMTMTQIASHERYGAADAMLPSRNFGATLYGSTDRQRVSWSAGVFNNWLNGGESIGNSATQTIGRVTWLPYLSDNESEIIHLGFGVRNTNAKQGLSYGTQPEIGDMPRFVDTGQIDADSSTLLNWELGWRRGPLWLMAEYTDNRVDAPNVGNPDFIGYHVSGAYSLTGEMRPYKKNRGVFGMLPVAQGVSQGGHGSMEIAMRYSSVDLSDSLIEGGELDVATIQFNWWLTSSMGLSLNYKRTWTDRFDLDGEMDALVVRVVLILN